VTGIAASRRLGSRLASFVALLEVLFALVFAWLLLDELPGPVQFAGATVVLAGVVLVKLGEREIRALAVAPEVDSVLSERPVAG
jgi:drug/metabolite transporter (DMT)-like permease